MRHSWLWRVLLVISILLALLFAPPSQAQGVPACTMGDLDITPQIADGPNNTYTLAVNFSNFSQHACSLNRSADEPSFYLQSAPSASLFTRCVSSKECAPSRASVDGPGVTLEPGGVGHQRYSWKTSPAVPDGPCVMAFKMDNSVNGYGHFNIMSPSLLRLICSPVIVGPYKSGAFPPDDRATAGEAQRAPTVRIIPAEDEYYERERHVPIRAVIDDPGKLLSFELHLCPVLLVRQLHWPSWVNFEEVRQKPCKVEPSGAGIQAEAVLEGGWPRGGYNLALFAVVALRNRQLMVIASPQFQLNIADPAAIERKWGPQLKGGGGITDAR